jgi:hypothetical protein
MKNRILFNISNHPSLNWSAEQREGWNEIVDIPFPNVSPTADMDEVRGLAISIARKVKEICREKGIERPCVMVQGEFSLCAFIYQTYRVGVFLPDNRKSGRRNSQSRWNYRKKDHIQIYKMENIKFVN